MAITDELRSFIKDPLLGYASQEQHVEQLTAIADRIDKALAERYVELPKDADGEPIHIGDVMDGVNKYDMHQEVTGRVTTISFDATLDPNDSTSVGIRVWADDNKSYRVIYIDPYASVYRHHHDPTVEDVLIDMHRRLSDVSELYDVDSDELEEEYTRIIEEYAAKLRLAGSDAE